ncbi:MAG: diacylglycerol kinase family protein [Candidatus Omnitrophica bacterium]|nr:diacylglycerol kinase family protein [Candidatus Omnitrophota bacterium]MCM8770641.1 diacylglycerol kinase family protein [Candidatus Omnitrophota bacterium]
MLYKLINKKILYDIFKLRPLKKSFSNAIEGIIYLFLCHRNMRLIFLVGIAVFLLGLYFELNGLEFAILFVTISGVFIAEMFNTAIELIIDTFTDKYHTLAKVIKDISAGVVLIACLNAVIVSYFLFGKKILFILK